MPHAWKGTAGALLLVVGLASPAGADVLIDDFEDVSDWRGLDPETTTVHGGAGAGRWDDQVTTTSISKDFAAPLDASAEAHVQFWLYSGVANGALIELVFDSDNDADPEGWDYYRRQLAVDWTGWRFFRIPLADFDVARHPLGWNTINSVQLSADGWSHSPLADTLLILDDMSFGTGAIAGLQVRARWDGADFVYDYTVTLEERAGRARTLVLSVDGGAGYPFAATIPSPSVALPAGGTADAAFAIRVPAAAITPATALDVHRATLFVAEGSTSVDGASLDNAVPLPGRAHPRTLLDAADLARIESWAAAQPWAANARDGVIARADSWPADFETEYSVSPWSLPPEGGQWTLWYVCPTHGVYLRHEGPGRHVCPVDGEVLTGWPYDQVVYSWMHSDLAASARDLGLAYRLTGDPAYAASAAEILRAYAAAYLGYPLHDVDGGGSASGAHVLSQTLDESIWLVPMAWAYDLIADSTALTDADRAAIEDELLRAAAATISRNQAGMSNWQSWHNAGIGAVGFALEDPVLIAQALRDATNGFEYQMDVSVSADGFWYEGSWGYHFFALDALQYLAEMAQRAGYDAYGDPALRSMFEAPVRFAMPDGSLPAFNDSGTLNVRTQRDNFEPAWNRYGDEAFAGVLSSSGRGREALFWGVETVPDVAAASLASQLFPDAGYAVLRAGSGDSATYLALDYGPHGGWHGHYDKLGFVLYGRGAVQGIDPGTQSYAAPTHTTWDKVTVAHNTVVIDGRTQAEATGRLHRFAALPALSAATADAGEAYATADLTRTMLVSSDYVLDRFDVHSLDAAAHDVDWVYHNLGTFSTPLPLAPYAGLPATDGYEHLSGERSATTAAGWSATFDANPADPGAYGSVWPSDPAIVATLSYSRDQAATGLWSGRMTYDFSAVDGYVIYSTDAPAALPEIPSGVRLALYGDGSGNSVSIRLYDSSDERFIHAVGPLDWTGWRTLEATDLGSWTHYLGNDDGVFDLPAGRISVELTHEDAGAATGTLYVDDVTLLYAAAGPQLVEDFEIPQRALQLTMLAEPSTMVVAGEGLGPDLLVPVPFVMARRRAADTSFVTLLEPYGAAPLVDSFRRLASDAPASDGAAAFAVAAAGFDDRLLFVADGAPAVRRTFGDGACDGTLCLVRRDAASALSRLGLAEGTLLEDAGTIVLESSVSLPALQADFAASGARLILHAVSPIESELRILGAAVTEVLVNGAVTAFARDGDYVVLNLVPTVEPDGGPGDGGDAADVRDADAGGDVGTGDGGGGGCSCGVLGGRRSAPPALVAGLLVVLRRLRRTRSR